LRVRRRPDRNLIVWPRRGYSLLSCFCFPVIRKIFPVALPTVKGRLSPEIRCYSHTEGAVSPPISQFPLYFSLLLGKPAQRPVRIRSSAPPIRPVEPGLFRRLRERPRIRQAISPITAVRAVGSIGGAQFPRVGCNLHGSSLRMHAHMRPSGHLRRTTPPMRLPAAMTPARENLCTLAHRKRRMHV